MRANKRLLIAGIVLLFVLSCSSMPLARPTPTRTLVPTITPTPAPTAIPLQSGTWESVFTVPTYSSGNLNVMLSFDIANNQVDSWSTMIVNCGMMSFGQRAQIKDNAVEFVIMNPCNFTGTQIFIDGKFTSANSVSGTVTYGKYNSQWSAIPK